MKKQGTAKPVERLFPFVLRSRILLIGRDTLRRSKSRLHFVLITRDISERGRAEMGVSEGDIVGTILGETGLPRTVVGAVDIRERHLFVDVASEHANSIISKMNRAQIKGRKAKVKVA